MTLAPRGRRLHVSHPYSALATLDPISPQAEGTGALLGKPHPRLLRMIRHIHEHQCLECSRNAILWLTGARQSRRNIHPTS